jgi:adenylylsulfate kinase-like enzyme
MSTLAARVEELMVSSEVRKIDLKDGDVLAVYVPRDISSSEASRMESRLKEISGLNIKVFVLPPGFDVAVIREAGVTDA